MTPLTTAGQALLDELAENPLDGARYAHHVVGLRLPLAERQAADRALAELRREVEGLVSSPAAKLLRTGHAYRQAARDVLALIDKASKPEEGL